MNSILAVLVIFLLGERTVVSNRFVLYENRTDAFLALIKKRDSPELELAIPEKSNERWEYAFYTYDGSKDETGPVQEFMIACPARSYQNDESAIEEKWREANQVSQYSKLFLLDEYPRDSISCHGNAIPSIEKAQKKNENGDVEYCGESEAEIYNVGFPVSNRELTKIQFMSIYKICHSNVEGKGTLYSIHSIPSPSLLLPEVWEYYKPTDKKLFKNTLDERDISEQSLYEKEYPYQFVGIDDMPTEVWRSTTQFTFNYTPITLNQEAMKRMMTVDNYIRLYRKETNKQITLYSGVYRTTVNKARLSCLPALCGKPIPINAFWRIIMDDEGFATIVVTQHTKQKCFEESFICHSNARVIVKEYIQGGCTYMCAINDELIERLGLPRGLVMKRLELPPLKFIGNLELAFTRKKRTGAWSSLSEGDENVDQQLSKKVTMFDFFGEVDFETALKNADPDLAFDVLFHKQSASDGYGGSGRRW